MLDAINLTQYEAIALDGPINAADGHARQSLTRSQQRIVDAFPALFEEAAGTPFEELEHRATQTFLHSLGQASAPVGTNRVITAYASSIAMDVTARCLAERGGAVGLVHPTFDNIPDLLKAWSLSIEPVEEAELLAAEPACLDRVRHLFVTTPNNPTGTVLPADALRALASACESRGVTLVLDTSFRGFDTRAQYDTYAILEQTGVDYIVIEDTGKLWPMLELKVGIMVTSPGLRLQVADAMSDILLSVSPFVLLVIEHLARDGADGGYERLHQLIATNRGILERALERSGPARVADPGSRASVARAELPLRVTGTRVWRALAARGIHLLPGGCFHWARPEEGERFVRVALARDPAVVEAVAVALADWLAWARPHPVCRARLRRRAALQFAAPA